MKDSKPGAGGSFGDWSELADDGSWCVDYVLVGLFVYFDGFWFDLVGVYLICRCCCVAFTSPNYREVLEVASTGV